MDTRCFASNIHDLGHTGLHAVGKLIGGDTGLDLRILQNIEPRLVEVPKDIQCLATAFAIHARRIPDVEHRIAL